ncbi:MAG TPA: GDP-mannose 4,6-dehydratase [Pyrinomonadaceae bacterium]|jgi:GDPmannose 4,6-dehydratase
MTKRALITGITGQDGSFLTELLLEKGYEVYGIIRRSSSFNTDRIDHLYQDPHEPGTRLRLLYGDLNDSSSLNTILRQTAPDEIYNLGAQSHVRVSFDVPEYTGEVTGLGTVRILEAIREAGIRPKFYQASSSELFGKVLETPQRETTPFYPRSPYGCAKAYAYWITVNYRESYGLFACNGILFNHECLSANTPLIVRRAGLIDICTPVDLVPLRRKGSSVQSFEPSDLEVWDGEQWTRVNAVTATKRRPHDKDHEMLSVQARAGVVDVTAHHGMLDASRERIRADRLHEGNQLALAKNFPAPSGWTAITGEMAEFLGHMTAGGYVPAAGITMQYTNNSDALRERVAELWSRLFLNTALSWFSRSGFAPGHAVGQLNLNSSRALTGWLRTELYTRNGLKKVPALILNASPEIQRAYLDGYYAGDGLKAGKGESIKTNSPVLAQGLCWLYSVQGRACSVYTERRGERVYYQLNISSADNESGKGQHLRKESAEIRRLEPAVIFDEWVFDIETESNVLCAGVGRIVVHNSERRGETFVSRKITRAATRIKLGLQEKLYLGNLDARRDWGYARDYVEAMWLMMQAEEPDDFVIATGETHSIREFLDEAFGYLDLDWNKYVEIDPRYFRPTEVDLLLGDASKARRVLGWEPRVSFKELVRLMVDSDLELARQEHDARAPQGASPNKVRWGTV